MLFAFPEVIRQGAESEHSHRCAYLRQPQRPRNANDQGVVCLEQAGARIPPQVLVCSESSGAVLGSGQGQMEEGYLQTQN